MAIAIRIVSKDFDFVEPRAGEIGELYLALSNLMADQPDDKIVATFKNRQQGERAVKRMVAWAAEDGLTLYTSPIKGTTDRQLYLGLPKEAE